MGYELEMTDERLTDKDKLTAHSDDVLDVTLMSILAARDHIVDAYDVSESAALGAVLAAVEALKRERMIRE